MTPAVTFDESRFAPTAELASNYDQRIAAGLEKMRDSRIVIAGLARNVAKHIPRLRTTIAQLGKRFADYRVLFYENDSSDQTPQLLQQWAREDSRIKLISESLGDPVHLPERCLHRAERMSFYRSRCQAEILDRWSDFDQVVLMDTDLEGGWSGDGIANTYGHDDWDFVGSNGIIYRRVGITPNIPIQYDAWAFRMHEDYRLMTTREVNQLVFRRGEPLKPLASCFGGLGVYQMQAFQNGVYSGGDIEHVGFHRTMREKGFGRIFLNPSQIVIYGRRHRKLDPMVARIQRIIGTLGLRTTTWYYASACQGTAPSDRASTTLLRKAS